MSALVYYQALENVLAASLAWHGEKDNAFDDSVRDEMDDVWLELNDEEHALLDVSNFNALVQSYRERMK